MANFGVVACSMCSNWQGLRGGVWAFSTGVSLPLPLQRAVALLPFAEAQLHALLLHKGGLLFRIDRGRATFEAQNRIVLLVCARELGHVSGCAYRPALHVHVWI